MYLRFFFFFLLNCNPKVTILLTLTSNYLEIECLCVHLNQAVLDHCPSFNINRVSFVCTKNYEDWNMIYLSFFFCLNRWLVKNDHHAQVHGFNYIISESNLVPTYYSSNIVSDYNKHILISTDCILKFKPLQILKSRQ